MTIQMFVLNDAYRIALTVYAAVAMLTFVVLWFVNAPYGRHMREGFGPAINANLGWLVMESVALLTMPVVALIATTSVSPVLIVLLILWLAHYTNRSIIYPWQRRASRKQMPLLICVIACLFNVLNGFANGLGLAVGESLYDLSWFWDVRFLSGLLLFAAGAALNIRSDKQILDLRKTASSDAYLVPEVGLHRHIAAPNYLGEIIQWFGWAIAAWSWAGLLFALYTVANLAPRAAAHLKWYRETFPDYPKSRKALIPFLW